MPVQQKILTVDDKEENLFALAQTLKDIGAEIIQVTSGDEALAATLHHDFALAIVDVHMPGMNGFELADLLRSDEKNLSLPIIFLTATFSEEESVYKGYASGGVDYIVKPYNPTVLKGKVTAFLELARYRKQLENIVEERTNNLRLINQILVKVRRVNQLIVREHDGKRLIREACKLLVEERGFSGAWIVVVDEKGDVVDAAHQGFSQDFDLFAQELNSGGLPKCCDEVKRHGGVLVISEVDALCWKCPLSSDRSNGHAMVTTLEHEGKLCGFLGLAVPATMAADDEEQLIFGEVAGDLAYALHNISVEKERQIAVEALRKSEELYRAIFNNVSVGIELLDRQTRFVEVNHTLAEFLGYTPEELTTLNVMDITHPDDLTRTKEKHAAVIRGDIPGYRLEKRYKGKTGAVLWADIAVSAIRNEDGQYQATVGVISDITQRKKSEEARARLAAAVEQAAEAVEITDRQGIVMYVNPAFERITGYSREEVVGKRPNIVKSGHHEEDVYQNMWQTISSGGTWTGHLINKKKNGTLFEEDVCISPLKDHTGTIVNYVAVKRDVTKEVSLQKQLLQAQKMEAIGTLAGGIAHDFNNLLQIALGYSELLLSGKNEADPEYSDLQKIHQSASSGSTLVRRLLTFSRKVEPNPVPTNLNFEVQQTEKLLRRTIPKMINIRLELDEKLEKANADPAQIEQIIMNLCVNARDAMEEGGTLTIRTENVTLDEDYCASHVETSPGNYVMLSVSDTGSGMDQETLQHIFEPFFTTKEVGKGTGLGLAVVYGIVKQHGGHITCVSEIGLGTTFTVYLPSTAKESEELSDTSGEMAPFGTETVLVVDDEDFVRELGQRLLMRNGYTVLSATTGEEALKVYSRENSKIGLVILDLVMPGMGGKDCLKGLLKIDPAAKVLIASGYAAEEVKKECATLGAKGFVAKPFRFNSFLTTVRRTLDAE